MKKLYNPLIGILALVVTHQFLLPAPATATPQATVKPRLKSSASRHLPFHVAEIQAGCTDFSGSISPDLKINIHGAVTLSVANVGNNQAAMVETATGHPSEDFRIFSRGPPLPQDCPVTWTPSQADKDNQGQDLLKA